MNLKDYKRMIGSNGAMFGEAFEEGAQNTLSGANRFKDDFSNGFNEAYSEAMNGAMGGMRLADVYHANALGNALGSSVPTMAAMEEIQRRRDFEEAMRGAEGGMRLAADPVAWNKMNNPYLQQKPWDSSPYIPRETVPNYIPSENDPMKDWMMMQQLEKSRQYGL